MKSSLKVVIKYVIDHFVESSYQCDLFGMMDLIKMYSERIMLWLLQLQANNCVNCLRNFVSLLESFVSEKGMEYV